MLRYWTSLITSIGLVLGTPLSTLAAAKEKNFRDVVVASINTLKLGKRNQDFKAWFEANKKYLSKDQQESATGLFSGNDGVGGKIIPMNVGPMVKTPQGERVELSFKPNSGSPKALSMFVLKAKADGQIHILYGQEDVTLGDISEYLSASAQRRGRFLTALGYKAVLKQSREAVNTYITSLRELIVLDATAFKLASGEKSKSKSANLFVESILSAAYAAPAGIWGETWGACTEDPNCQPGRKCLPGVYGYKNDKDICVESKGRNEEALARACLDKAQPVNDMKAGYLTDDSASQLFDRSRKIYKYCVGQDKDLPDSILSPESQNIKIRGDLVGSDKETCERYFKRYNDLFERMCSEKKEIPYCGGCSGDKWGGNSRSGGCGKDKSDVSKSSNKFRDDEDSGCKGNAGASDKDDRNEESHKKVGKTEERKEGGCSKVKDKAWYYKVGDASGDAWKSGSSWCGNNKVMCIGGGVLIAGAIAGIVIAAISGDDDKHKGAKSSGLPPVVPPTGVVPVPPPIEAPPIVDPAPGGESVKPGGTNFGQDGNPSTN